MRSKRIPAEEQYRFIIDQNNQGRWYQIMRFSQTKLHFILLVKASTDSAWIAIRIQFFNFSASCSS